MIANRRQRGFLFLCERIACTSAMLAILWPAMAGSDAVDQVPVGAAALTAVSVVQTAQMEGYKLRRVYSGSVEPYRSSNVGFERAGLLAEVFVREGDQVTPNQVLASLDTALLEARRRELAASLAQAEADLALAEATLERYRDSVQEGAVTRQALDEASAAERAASAAVELARARIGSVDLDITRSRLSTPFAGVVTQRLADEGRVLEAGEPVLQIQEARTPELRIGVAGPLVDRLQPGRLYPLHYAGRAFDARLRAVLPVRAGAARTVDALFTPVLADAPRGQVLRPGDLVELHLSQWIEEPGIWLPLTALTRGLRGLWNVYLADLDEVDLEHEGNHRIGLTGRLRLQPVEVLHQANEHVFVRAGLPSGSRIVANGLHRIVPGQQVRVLESANAQLARHKAAAATEAH
ncbi:MAG: efflux RND transporter periplasmic adaptor subunit [Thiohalocapsa sp. PB-PSB1]|jgi:RND family efflux transporter MFP subunit|nr:MAG: efflux RND transporter periplasmic adaptor subunit [Thiohalocapsa sp. PB-PSB1]